MFYTGKEPPQERDPFFPVQDLIDAWNENMKKVFHPSWIVVIDESISVWLNKYTCPGFMCVPCKPWPFGNEYHTACCALSGIMFYIELVEGKK